MAADIQTKRIYAQISKTDGCRVLVDRVWPRGIRKADAKLDLWLKDIAPSTELRKWFGHDPDRFREFRRRYQRELESNTDAVESLIILTQQHKQITLLYAARDTEHNHAVVLTDYLQHKINR